MEFLYEYGLFLLKAITFVVVTAIIIALAVSAGSRKKLSPKGTIEVTRINDRLDEMRHALKREIEDDNAVKRERKEKQKQQKKQKKLAKKQLAVKQSVKKQSAGKQQIVDSGQQDKRVFLVDFEGDIRASAVAELREVISAILSTATVIDEVVVRLESSGGMVPGYGLAASQLHRLRKRSIPLTVCVDKVAASGGYMMACVANKILAAPFAIVGSIGVVAQLPNFHKLLKKNDIDYEQLTAGEYKRTLTLFGENTDKARKKFVQDLELTHQLFKDFVQEQRSVVTIDDVATGEIWYGTSALEKHLVDELLTSDDYVTDLASEHAVYQVSYEVKKSLPERLGYSLQSGIEHSFARLLTALRIHRLFH